MFLKLNIRNRIGLNLKLVKKTSKKFGGPAEGRSYVCEMQPVSKLSPMVRMNCLVTVAAVRIRESTG